MMPMVRPGPVLTQQEAASYCGIAYSTFRSMRSNGDSPLAHEFGSKKVFFPEDLDVWLAAHLTPVEPVSVAP